MSVYTREKDHTNADIVAIDRPMDRIWESILNKSIRI